VQVKLVDAETGTALPWDWNNGAPSTRAGGKLVIEEGRKRAVTVDADSDGTVTRSISGASTISIRYVPTSWNQSAPQDWSGPVYRGGATSVSASYSLKQGNLTKVFSGALITVLPFLMLYLPMRAFKRIITNA
jgi:hypothetical protein